MWFWNRVEVYCGYSMKDFSELRDVLAAHNLKYDYKLVNHCGYRHNGSLCVNPNYQTQYYLYVHRNEYENAMYLMQNRKNHL